MADQLKQSDKQTPTELLIATAVTWRKDPQVCSTSDLMMAVDTYLLSVETDNNSEQAEQVPTLPYTDSATLARLSGVLDVLEKEIAVGAKVPTLDLSNPFTKTLVNAALDWEAHDSTNNEQLLKSSINAYKASDEYKTLARTLGTAVERIVDLNTRPEMTTEQVRNIIDDLTHLIKE